MKTIAVATVLALLPLSALAADKASKRAPKKAPPAPAAAKACPEFGLGFVRLEGSSTCVKIGGHVRFEAGGRR